MKFVLISIGLVGVLLGSMPSQAADGKAVYIKACAVCHNALPPKLGDKAEWEPRFNQGVNIMVMSVVKGKGTMPPRAGNNALSDADIKAAVEYMAAQVK